MPSLFILRCALGFENLVIDILMSGYFSFTSKFSVTNWRVFPEEPIKNSMLAPYQYHVALIYFLILFITILNYLI